jgi:hypothetical protein
MIDPQLIIWFLFLGFGQYSRAFLGEGSTKTAQKSIWLGYFFGL